MRWGPTGLELLKLTKDAFQLGLDGFQLGCNLVVAHLCCDNASGRSKQEKDATKGSAGSLFLDALRVLTIPGFGNSKADNAYPTWQTRTLQLRSDLSSPAVAFRGQRSCPLTFVCCARVRFRCTGFRAMMQRVGAADLRPCSCPGGLSLLRGHKVSRSSNAQKTCMKANTFQVEVHPLQAS